MCLTHLRIRIQRGIFHYYLRKWFFWTQKTVVPLGKGKKTLFSSTLNVRFLQMVKNETVRFGRLIVGSIKIGSNFALSDLLSKGAVWR
jgi:hypothetical protein